ncbi:DUF3265 domain-containing protein [Vibrio anguillarum]|uniref:DUF3265 domain-containing protein n=1 Tax=Vibrio anguillarum TaxID=55601 RepID=A0ABR9ZBG5_VIBAN|nr:MULTISPECIES: DUF3265 domain-containing protein [Vibrio]EJL6677188.1 DUF3265 domain-containing protein [Vibrio cholerae]ELY5209077.1 DUF3265 domain-containing protein [Vibrio cholerae]MBF4247041.1 DUF3265 domain-containing protein [Vibrio anguillarum]MBF4279570.1 DUF3265 domain-containing protein [Vibrio anguillarum]MBF4375337.1 DUF3265 domain-containing protein [Vibrio anguillarum]
MLTSCLRGIQHAWHFYCASVFVFKAQCGNYCIACFTP